MSKYFNKTIARMTVALFLVAVAVSISSTRFFLPIVHTRIGPVDFDSRVSIEGVNWLVQGVPSENNGKIFGELKVFPLGYVARDRPEVLFSTATDAHRGLRVFLNQDLSLEAQFLQKNKLELFPVVLRVEGILLLQQWNLIEFRFDQQTNEIIFRVNNEIQPLIEVDSQTISAQASRIVIDAITLGSSQSNILIRDFNMSFGEIRNSIDLIFVKFCLLLVALVFVGPAITYFSQKFVILLNLLRAKNEYIVTFIVASTVLFALGSTFSSKHLVALNTSYLSHKYGQDAALDGPVARIDASLNFDLDAAPKSTGATVMNFKLFAITIDRYGSPFLVLPDKANNEDVIIASLGGPAFGRHRFRLQYDRRAETIQSFVVFWDEQPVDLRSTRDSIRLDRYTFGVNPLALTNSNLPSEQANISSEATKMNAEYIVNRKGFRLGQLTIPPVLAAILSVLLRILMKKRDRSTPSHLLESQV